MLKKISAIFLSLLICSCQLVDPSVSVPLNTSGAAGKNFSFNVAKIEIVQEYQPTTAFPNIDHLYTETPNKAVIAWAKSHLSAKGTVGLMRVVIKDASVIQEPLPKNDDWTSWFTPNQDVKYTAHLDVKLEVYASDPLFPQSEVSLTASRSQPLSEDDSIRDRSNVFYNLTNDLMADFNTEAEKNISTYLYKYL